MCGHHFISNCKGTNPLESTLERCTTHQTGSNPTAGSEAMQQRKDWSKNDVQGAPSNTLFNRLSPLHFSRLKVQGRQVSLAGRVEAKCREKRSTSRRCYSEAKEKSAFGDPSWNREKLIKDMNFPRAPIFSLATSPEQVPLLPQSEELLSLRR